MLKLSLTVASAVSLLATLIATPALADCDYESEQLGIHKVVPEWSYQHSFRSTEPLADQCSREAEDVDCEAEGLYGLECAEKMQRLFASCVGAEVCREAAQGWLEDDGVTGESLGAMYGACLDLVAAAGGSGR